jgi:hypothetical protein
MAGPAMLLQRTGPCLRRALAVIIWLRVLIASVLEATRSNRKCHAVHQLASCRRLGGAIEAWRAIPNHNSYINELLYDYAQRVGLMKQLDCDTLFVTETPGDQLEADWRP